MKEHFRKQDFPVEKIRRHLEPGPVVPVSSAWKDENNIMTMGWHTVMGFSPSLIGCMISSAHRSFEMVRHSRGCVSNIPTTALTDAVVGIGNTIEAAIDKFSHCGLADGKAKKVKAPIIEECCASSECRLADNGLAGKYNFLLGELCMPWLQRLRNICRRSITPVTAFSW